MVFLATRSAAVYIINIKLFIFFLVFRLVNLSSISSLIFLFLFDWLFPPLFPGIGSIYIPIFVVVGVWFNLIYLFLLIIYFIIFFIFLALQISVLDFNTKFILYIFIYLSSLRFLYIFNLPILFYNKWCRLKSFINNNNNLLNGPACLRRLCGSYLSI